jgi:hypothetical protein
MRDWEAAGGDGAKVSPLFSGEKREAELQTEIAEREAEGFRVVMVSWQR